MAGEAGEDARDHLPPITYHPTPNTLHPPAGPDTVPPMARKTDMPALRVTAGVLRRAGRILACRRKEGSLAGKWEFPGGKIEPNETAEDCLARELEEELGLRARVRQLLHREIHTEAHRTIELLFFDVSCPRGTLTLRDHDAARWVRPADLLRYDWAPADAAFVRRLVRAG
jgi:8-oxo-dGTP diphosphatase